MAAADVVGVGLGDLLDVDAAHVREQHHRLLAQAVPDDAGVVLLLHGDSLVDEHAARHVAVDLERRGCPWRVASASSGASANFTPPAFMRPPVSTCDLMTTGPPISSASLRASSGVVARPPLDVGCPRGATICSGLVLEEAHGRRGSLAGRYEFEGPVLECRMTRHTDEPRRERRRMWNGRRRDAWRRPLEGATAAVAPAVAGSVVSACRSRVDGESSRARVATWTPWSARLRSEPSRAWRDIAEPGPHVLALPPCERLLRSRRGGESAHGRAAVVEAAVQLGALVCIRGSKSAQSWWHARCRGHGRDRTARPSPRIPAYGEYPTGTAPFDVRRTARRPDASARGRAFLPAREARRVCGWSRYRRWPRRAAQLNVRLRRGRPADASRSRSGPQGLEIRSGAGSASASGARCSR